MAGTVTAGPFGIIKDLMRPNGQWCTSWLLFVPRRVRPRAYDSGADPWLPVRSTAMSEVHRASTRPNRQ